MRKEEIFLIKSIYALPIYSPEFIRTDLGEFPEIKISDTLFMDSLLCQLRGAIIDLSKILKKQERMEEKLLLDKIAQLEKADDTSHLKQDLPDNARTQLISIIKNRIKGSLIRSQLTKDWKKPYTYF